MADAAAELDEGGVVRTLKDLFAGAAGGIAQVLLGEFDICCRSTAVSESGFSVEITCWHRREDDVMIVLQFPFEMKRSCIT